MKNSLIKIFGNEIRKRWAFLFLVFAYLLICPDRVYAQLTNQLYIYQPTGSDKGIGAGSDNGADCADAYPISWFNNSANWGTGSGQIGPGTTVHLCGSIQVDPGVTALTVYGSGTSSNPITIVWETGAVITSAAMATGINCNGHSYLVIDGNGTTPSITNTDNGSVLTYQQKPSDGVVSHGGSNNEIKNLTITNLYVHTANSNTTSSGVGISYNGSNYLVHDNAITNAYIGIENAAGNGDNNNRIYNNTLNDVNWGMYIAPQESNYTLHDVFIYHNNIQNLNNWDDVGDPYHHDGIFVVGQDDLTDSIYNIYIYNNLFNGNNGADVTAWIYMNSGIHGIYVFNNTFTGNGSGWNIEGGHHGDTNYFILNNYINCGGAGGIYVNQITNITIENNVMNNCYTYIYSPNSATYPIVLGTGTIDHNAYDLTGSSSSHAFSWDTGSTLYSTYQALLSNNPILDADSIRPSSLGVNSSGQPQTGSALIGAGANLTLLGITALNSDEVGSTRPTSGAWDIGPYQSGAIYIAQAAAGSGNGADCADAYPITWFNTPGNWGTATGEIGPGTTVHVCGTISSSLTPPGSGSAGNPVTVYFEPNAVMTAPTWPETSWDSGGAIYLDGNSNIILDGGSNGVIQATNSNSTSEQSSVGIMLSSVSNVEVRNFTINNMYVRTSSTDSEAGGWGITIAGTTSNVSVYNNTISQAEYGIDLVYENSSSQISIYANTLSGNSNSISVGEAATDSGLNDLQIYGNNITGSGTEWDLASDAYHHNGIHVFAVASGDSVTNVKIYDNYIHGNWGTNVTSWIFIEDKGSNQGMVNPMIFNNVLYADGNGPVDDGLIFTKVSNTQIFNNTIVTPPASADSGSPAIVITPDTSSAADDQITNNIIYNFGVTSGANGWIYDTGTGDYSSSDNFINQNPEFVNLSGLNFQLTAASLAIGAGVNLTYLGITDLNTDAAGTTRFLTGLWDIGAYQYSTAPTVYLTSPSNSTSYTAPTTVNISAAASATTIGATITSVAFYNGTTLLATSTSSPYNYSWTNVATGTYTLTAVATDSDNNSTTSAAVSITVNAASVMLGDVNGDGNVTITDAELVAQAAVGLITLTPTQLQAAEVDATGKLDIYGAYPIAEYAEGNISKFPVQQ